MLKKYFLCLLLVLSITSYTHAKAKSYDQAVSLGYGCQVAIRLEHNGFRTLAYPFDWVHTPVDSLLKFIANKGANFLDADKIASTGAYPGDPSRLQVIDLVYGITSYHDFLTTPYFGNYLEVKAKYDRRVQRFFELLESNQKILFVRQKATRAEIEYLDEVLRSSYPRLSYTILALHDTEEYCYNWGLERVRNFYIRDIPSDWQGDGARWTEILSQFSIIPNANARSPEEVW